MCLFIDKPFIDKYGYLTSTIGDRCRQMADIGNIFFHLTTPISTIVVSIYKHIYLYIEVVSISRQIYVYIDVVSIYRH